MVESNKTEEFLQKLAPCIERGELEACVEEAAQVAGEMGIGAEELLDLSTEEGANGKYGFAYVIALAAAQGLQGEEQAEAYFNAGLASRYTGNIEKAEEHYRKAIEANPKYAAAHNNYANLLREKEMFFDAEKEVRIALQIQPKYSYALGIYGDILADEDYLEEALEKYNDRFGYEISRTADERR